MGKWHETYQGWISSICSQVQMHNLHRIYSRAQATSQVTSYKLVTCGIWLSSDMLWIDDRGGSIIHVRRMYELLGLKILMSKIWRETILLIDYDKNWGKVNRRILFCKLQFAKCEIEYVLEFGSEEAFHGQSENLWRFYSDFDNICAWTQKVRKITSV